MPASARSWRRPRAMLLPPSQAARIGLGDRSLSSASAWAMAVGLVMAWGVTITRTASAAGSCRTISTALARRLERASPRTSTGLPCDQQGGSDLVQPRQRLRRQRRQHAAGGDQGVDGHHARAAGVGHDGQAVAPGGSSGGRSARRSRRSRRCPGRGPGRRAGTRRRRSRPRRPAPRCARRPPGPTPESGRPCRPRWACRGRRRGRRS